MSKAHFNRNEQYGTDMKLNNDRYIRILCWNIQGLSNDIIDNDYFRKCMNENDIIILTETWLSEHLDICDNEFYCYHYMRPMHARARRPSGGISIMLRHQLRGKSNNNAISIIKESECFIWFKLDRHLFEFDRDLYICASYIPPENSSFWTVDKSDPYDQLEQDCAKFQNRGNVIISGDFNARTGSKPDHVPDFMENDNIEHFALQSSTSVLDSSGKKIRNNQDCVVNSYGNKLLSLCKSLNLRILNGRTLGDSAGAFTSFQYNGRSTVDYVIADENIIHKIPTLSVSPPTHLSDHAHISFRVSNGIINKTIIHTKDETMVKLIFKWTEDSPALYRSALEMPNLKHNLDKCMIDNSIDKQYNVNNLCHKLTDFMTDAAKLCMRTIKKPKIRRRKNKIGFDYDCIKLKNSILRLGKLVHKFPKDTIIYGKFQVLKKQFKKLIKQKNKEAKDNIMKQIMECEGRDPKMFWNLLNDLRGKNKENINPINLNTWTSYFK